MEAKRNAEQIEGDVQKWLTDVSTAMECVRKLEEEVQLNKTCFIGWCPCWSWRYQLSKEATKKKANIVKLQENGRFGRVSYIATLPGIEIFSSKDFMPCKTTTSAFVQIMEALMDEKSDIIGLYGLGGTGKTTLAKEVGKKAKEKGLFDVVAMVVVSQPLDFKKIQDQIAYFLGLNLDGAVARERVSRLCSRLKGEKKILIILDDVWDRFDLPTVEIPYGDDHDGCKILLTTRCLHVCKSMGSKKNISFDVFSDMEARDSLKKSAALEDNSVTLNDVAMEVARECKSRFVDIEDADKDKNVYACLKLSNDYLADEGTKRCILLCSLLPEDYKINMEDLVRYVMGLHLFKYIYSIEDARSQLCAKINTLKASSLLLETPDPHAPIQLSDESYDLQVSSSSWLLQSSDEQFVKMHDVVRDVVLWIASKEDNVFMVRVGLGLEEWPKEKIFEQHTAISLMADKIKVLPSKLECPRLEILLLGGEESLIVPETFFESMKALKVLTLSHGFLFPQSHQFLTSLMMLRLEYCKFKDISLHWES